MFQRIKSTISRNLTNSIGWRTNRKILVIESDDWGSIRMPSTAVYESYKSLGYDIDSSPYCKYDTLANTEDLNALFDILLRHTNNRDEHPKITFNTVIANPKFDKIEQSHFEEYFYEPFTETLKRYYPNEDVFKVWKKGIAQSIITPQFHGREHVNVPIWLEQLKNGNEPLKAAFKMGFWGIPENLYNPLNVNIQASFDSANSEHIEFQKQNIIQGLKLFEEIFDCKSETFIPNNYIFSEFLSQILKDEGVVGIQGMKYHKIPREKHTRLLKHVYTGKRNNFNQVYMVRNCVFEPSQMPENYENVQNCIKEISQSFFWNKPAILTSHRLNFIGSLVPENRDKNLILLDDLLKKIIEKWPDVAFMSSNELVNEMIVK